MASFDYDRRLFSDVLPFNSRPAHQQAALINQRNIWRGYHYETFKNLTLNDYRAASTPVYHIEEMPIDTLFIGFAHLTSVGERISLDQLQTYFLNRAQLANIQITSMVLSSKRNSDGRPYWQGILDFQGNVEVHRETFDIPRAWGPDLQYLSPVWSRSRAISKVLEDRIESLSYNQQHVDPLEEILGRGPIAELFSMSEIVLGTLLTAVQEFGRGDENGVEEDSPDVSSEIENARTEERIRDWIQEPRVLRNAARVERRLRRYRRRLARLAAGERNEQ